jgi:hypothetical protein
MKVLKHVLVSVVCLLVLASSASAALTRMTKEELHSLVLKYCRPAAGAEVPSPAAFLKAVLGSKTPRPRP